jgi:hypothetical protein
VASSTFDSIIKKYFYKNGGLSRLKGELSVYYWPKVAGNEIAKKVEAIRYRDGFLYLQTDVPALAQQILFMVPSFLDKYQKYIGKGVLKGIKVKVGTIKTSLSKPILSVNDFSLEQSELLTIETCKSTIEDTDLAVRFEKLMEKSYLVQKKQKADGGKTCLSCGVIIDSQFDYCPCCELKVKEEVQAYLSYQKIHNPGKDPQDPSDLEGLSHLKIKKLK